jgi:hypothetical protein
LPIFSAMTDEEVATVIQSVRNVCARNRREDLIMPGDRAHTLWPSAAPTLVS